MEHPSYIVRLVIAATLAHHPIAKENGSCIRHHGFSFLFLRFVVGESFLRKGLTRIEDS
jgi:hypothetical protein